MEKGLGLAQGVSVNYIKRAEYIPKRNIKLQHFITRIMRQIIRKR